MNQRIPLLAFLLLIACFSCNSGSSTANESIDQAETEKIVTQTLIIDSLSTELEEETQKLDDAMNALSQEFDQ